MIKTANKVLKKISETATTKFISKKTYQRRVKSNEKKTKVFSSQNRNAAKETDIVSQISGINQGKYGIADRYKLKVLNCIIQNTELSSVKAGIK